MLATHSARFSRRTAKRVALCLLVVALAASWKAGVGGLQRTASSEPLAITMADAQHTVIGFVYSPAVLANLLSHQSDEAPSQLIVAAANQSTPVVAMWTPPVPAEVGPPLRSTQWKIVVLPSGNLFGADRIEPRWIEHDLSAVAPIGSRLTKPFIGAVAAFSVGDLSKGRRICLYAEYPPDYEKKKAGMVTRCADL